MNIPGKGAEGDVSEAGLRDLLESSGLSVHSVAFDAPGGSDKRRIAYVRLEPPQPSWTLKTEVGIKSIAYLPCVQTTKVGKSFLACIVFRHACLPDPVVCC